MSDPNQEQPRLDDNNISNQDVSNSPTTVSTTTKIEDEDQKQESVESSRDDAEIFDMKSKEEEAMLEEDGSVDNLDSEKSLDDEVKPVVKRKRKKKRRQPKRDVAELRLQGRTALCKRIADIAPHMLKTVKLRVLGRHLDSTKGMDDEALTHRIVKEAKALSHKKRILDTLHSIDPNVNRRNLKSIILYAIILQEETHSLEERRLEEKVIEYEKKLIAKAKKLDFFDPKKHDQKRWHHYDTYRIVLEAAWRNQDDISHDEAGLLTVLRQHLNISLEEHWLIGAHIKRFPKAKYALHTPDEIHDARKELQREGILWSYRDENNRTIDILPHEIVSVIRKEEVSQELQLTNYRRILHHDDIRLSDLRNVLIARDMDRYGNKEELIERIVNSDIKPSSILSDLDRGKLSEMCRQVGLKSSGNKAELISRLLEFYDDLTFEERVTQDEREEWYNNYELLAGRAYSDLKAKKMISKDLEIEHQFEKATDFLFEKKLNVKIDNRRKVTKADGRIPLDNNQVILWDCKSAEGAVNLQDHLEDQFDGYLRKERDKGNQPLAFLVIAPAFTSQSMKLAYQFKARTNWDVALIRADALKYLADQWSTSEPDNAFPVRLLNRTEVIDKERVDFLLSLA